MITPKQATGNWGEDKAAGYLKKSGFRVLHRNWRKGSYELDIVCSKAGMLIFVEVKTRTASSLESPVEALTRSKQKSLLRAASEYLKASNAWDLPCRFDLICVSVNATGHDLEHIENAFDFNSSAMSLDSGYTAWQPW